MLHLSSCLHSGYECAFCTSFILSQLGRRFFKAAFLFLLCVYTQKSAKQEPLKSSPATEQAKARALWFGNTQANFNIYSSSEAEGVVG